MAEPNAQPATKRAKSATTKAPKKEKPAAAKRRTPDSENTPGTQPQKKVRKPPSTTTPRKAAPRRKKPPTAADTTGAEAPKAGSDSEEDSNALFEDDGYGGEEEEEVDKVKELLAHFTAQQNERYEYFRRSGFPRKQIKSVCTNIMYIYYVWMRMKQSLQIMVGICGTPKSVNQRTSIVMAGVHHILQVVIVILIRFRVGISKVFVGEIIETGMLCIVNVLCGFFKWWEFVLCGICG